MGKYGTKTPSNKITFILYLILSSIGIMLLFYHNQTIDSILPLKQVTFFFISMLISYSYFRLGNIKDLIHFPLKDYKVPYFHLTLSLILLILVLYLGDATMGATRRFYILGIAFQPSYYARIIMVFLAAHIISKHKDLIKENKIKELVKKAYPSIIYIIVTTILIFQEPHLSILLITYASIGLMLILAGLPWKTVGIVFLVGIILLTGVFSLGKSYRSTRIQVYKKYLLINPFRHEVKVTSDEERQIRESLIAISCGNFFGNDFKFTNTLQKYVSESETDYVFTLIADVLGFFGAIVILAIYSFLFVRIFSQSYKLENDFERFVAMGLCLNFLVTVVINTGVAISILPSTGISLPFISYGGSAFLFESFSLGIVLNLISKGEMKEA